MYLRWYKEGFFWHCAVESNNSLPHLAHVSICPALAYSPGVLITVHIITVVITELVLKAGFLSQVVSSSNYYKS